MKLNEINFFEPITKEKAEEIREWLRNNTVSKKGKFGISLTGVIHYVDDDIMIKAGVKELPYEFGNCTGNFTCGCDMISLKNCPKSLDDEVFSCDGAKNITTLKGVSKCREIIAYNSGIKKIKDIFPHIKFNLQHLSLDNLRITSWVGVNALCKKNKIENIYLTFFDDTVGGLGLLLIPGLEKLHIESFPFHAAAAKAAAIISKYSERPEDIYECQAELIENGLDQFAEI